MQAISALLVGIAAVGALIYSGLSTNATRDEISATRVQLQIAEQGPIIDQYHAAITDLGSSFVDVRLGGVYALQSIMQNSPPDQPIVVAVLCAFVRDHARPSTVASPWSPAAPQISPDPTRLPSDVQAALTVVSTRDGSHDGSATIIDLSRVNLAGANLSGAYLAGADLAGADLTGADLAGADLTGADLSGADLSGADLADANLTGAFLTRAKLTGANLTGARHNGHADLLRERIDGKLGQ